MIKDIIAYIRNRRVLKHIVFWCLIYTFLVFTQSSKEPFWVIAIAKLSHLIPHIISSYFLAYWLVPKYLYSKKHLQFFIFGFISAYIICVFSRILMVHVAEPLFRVRPFEQEPIVEILTDWRKLIKGYFLNIYSITFLFLFVKLSLERVEEQSLNKEKTAIELKMLKAQLNPHFLFNTLNNIYSLSVINSPKTSESIGKLSEILDYVLYRCDQKYVPLSGEIMLLENYISLERLRYDERLEVTFTNNVSSHTKIAPLILLSIVENAFKHGAGEDSGSPKITIDLQQKDSTLTFRVFNTTANQPQKNANGAIGLDNIKKQLELLYPNTHTITIEQRENSFQVIITLKTTAYES
ncbi:histidine kinase [Kordia sp.]|uniref:sensor histidine kinase n=1 Tax=Kordia sp. TaxID=1965332 RepID=UPI0025BDE244|nr:histidine kinase [Kordia sp.]MCH2193385.1 histidine kinase [Kordia sp.]